MSSSVHQMPKDVQAVHGAWPGGPCPKCGDDMPANVVHCMTCRHMLNSALSDDTIEVPQFVPLQEIDLTEKPAVSRGHYIRCEGCGEELRINAKYLGAAVQCRHCEHTFKYTPEAEKIAMYADCPHCDKEIRAGMKYVGYSVACRFCNGPLKLEDGQPT